MNLDWIPADLRALVEKATEPQRVTIVLYGEGRSEPLNGLVAVGCAIRNRVKTDLGNDGKPDWWGEGYSEVVLKKQQFSCLFPAGGEKNYKRVLQFAERLVSGQAITDPKERQCIWVAHGVIGDYVLDITKNSTHYHVATQAPRPKWARGLSPVIQCGGHSYYTNVP